MTLLFAYLTWNQYISIDNTCKLGIPDIFLFMPTITSNTFYTCDSMVEGLSHLPFTQLFAGSNLAESSVKIIFHINSQ